MIIVIKNWKNTVYRLLGILLLTVTCGVSVPVVAGILQEKVPVFQTWFEEEKPSGNPMRVEYKDDYYSLYNEKIDQYVINLQELNFEEKE